MSALLIALLMLLWYAIGVASFIYWWTSEENFTTNEVPLAMLLGCFGPLTFCIGMLIYRYLVQGATLIKRRKP